MTKTIMLALLCLAGCATDSPDPSPDAAPEQLWQCSIHATCGDTTTTTSDCIALRVGETPGGQTALRCPDGCSCAIVACSEGCAQ